MSTALAQGVFVAYLLGVLLIGVYASRFTRYTPTDFYIADRSVGTVVLGLTLAATVLSAFTVFGIGASTSQTGLGSFSFLAVAAVLYTLFFATVGTTLFEVGKERDVVTPAEYVRERFDSPALGALYLAVTGVFMLSLIAGQLIGGGVALDVLMDIPYVPAVLAIAAFMIVYIHIAGYRGVIWSDTVQATVLFVVLAAVTLYILLAFDSTAIAGDAAAETPALFETVGPAGVWEPRFIITAAIAFAFGVPGYPHTIQRYFSAGDASIMRRSGVLFAVVAIPIYLFGALLGVWSVGVIPSPETVDHVIPLLIEELMHPLVFGVVMAGATAAIMSTADSVALTLSSMLSRDLYREFVATGTTDRGEVRVTPVFPDREHRRRGGAGPAPAGGHLPAGRVRRRRLRDDDRAGLPGGVLGGRDGRGRGRLAGAGTGDHDLALSRRDPRGRDARNPLRLRGRRRRVRGLRPRQRGESVARRQPRRGVHPGFLERMSEPR